MLLTQWHSLSLSGFLYFNYVVFAVPSSYVISRVCFTVTRMLCVGFSFFFFFFVKFFRIVFNNNKELPPRINIINHRLTNKTNMQYIPVLKHEGIEAFLSTVGEINLGNLDDNETLGERMTAEEFEEAGESLIAACPGVWGWVGDCKEVLCQKQANCYKRCTEVADDFEKKLSETPTTETAPEEADEGDSEDEFDQPGNDEDDDPQAVVNIEYPTRVYDINIFRHTGRSVPTCCFVGTDTKENRILTTEEMFEDVMPNSRHIITARIANGMMHIHTCQHAKDIGKRAKQMRDPPKHHRLSTFLSLVKEHLPTIAIQCCSE